MNRERMNESAACRRVEAAEWVVVHQDGDLSAFDRRRFRRWLQRHPENARCFEQLSATWEMAGCLARDSSSAQRTVTPRLSRRFTHRLVAPLMAASLGVFFLAILILNAVYGPVTGSRAQNVVLQSHNAPERHLLSDGSTVTLNAGSRLEVDFSPSSRRVRLTEGEALFEVHRDRRRDFTVTAGPATLTVLGTVFDVELIGEEVSLAILEGQVLVNPQIDNGPIASHVATTGQHVRVAPLGKLTISEFDDPATIIAWTEGWLVFAGEPLHAVIEKINRRTSTRIVVAAPSSQDTPIYGSFRTDDVTGVATALAAALDLQVRVDREGRMLLEPRGLSDRQP